MWKGQTGERAPFWCILLVFTRADGQCFMYPVIVHQAKEYSQYLHHNIPLDWIVHHTSSGYMDRHGWLKAMTQLSNICGASPVNNQILFFDGQDSHFNDRARTKMQSKNIQPFILKAGDSINNQPNNNGPNSKLKALYNRLKAKWMLNYGTTRLQPHHMNSVLVESWDAFKVSSGKIIVDSFAKTHTPPLIPPNMIKNTQAMVASSQTSSKVFNWIAEGTVAPIQLEVTRNNDPMVIIRLKGGNQQPSRNILLRAAAYDTVQKRTVLPLQEIKRETMMILQQKKLKPENEDASTRRKPNSTSGIYLIAYKFSQYRQVAADRREMDEAENITAKKTATRNILLQLKRSESFYMCINSMNSLSSSTTD